MIVRALFISLIMVIGAMTAGAIAPTYRETVRAPDLAALMPEAFGEWTPLEIADAVLPPEVDLGPGEAVIYRAWTDRAGRMVTLVAAYGPPLGDSVRLHRPELCYRSQGYSLLTRELAALEVSPEDVVQTIRLDTQKALRPEAVTYWLRDGDNYVVNAQDHQLLFFHRGLSDVHDGALIRVSSKGEGSAGNFALHERFLRDFVEALPADGRALFLASDA